MVEVGMKVFGKLRIVVVDVGKILNEDLVYPVVWWPGKTISGCCWIPVFYMERSLSD